MFQARVASHGDFYISKDAIQNLIEDLIAFVKTSKGSRELDPNYGNPIYDYIHELNTKSVQYKVAKDVEMSIRKYFPFLHDVKVSIQNHPANDFAWWVAIGIVLSDKKIVLLIEQDKSGRVKNIYTRVL